MTDIVSNARRNIIADFRRCSYCNVMNNHEKTQNFTTLPSVLIIALERFQHSQFAPVEPTTILHIDGVLYVLKAVISHHGRYVSRGHITASLYQGDNLWITCDDKKVSIPHRQEPRNGVVFIYDKLEDVDSPTPNLFHEQSTSTEACSPKKKAKKDEKTYADAAKFKKNEKKQIL